MFRVRVFSGTSFTDENTMVNVVDNPQEMLAKLFVGNGGESLRELLEQKGEPILVRTADTVRAAGRAIARGRQAVSGWSCVS